MVDIIKTDDVVTAMRFGRFGREDGALVMSTSSKYCTYYYGTSNVAADILLLGFEFELCKSPASHFMRHCLVLLFLCIVFK